MSTPTAHGQEPTALERGRSFAEEADFERALGALNEADATDLTREERVVLYSTRALVSFALGRGSEAERDLGRLLALGANASLTESAPPQMRETFERLRRRGVRPPVLEVNARVDDGMARIDAEATGGADLLRGVRLWVFDEGWHASPRVERRLRPNETLRWYAEAFGPSDIRLAVRGTRAQPNQLRVLVDRAVLRQDASEAGGDDDAWAWWVGVGTGVAALAGVAVTLAVVLGASGEGTQLSGPRLEL